MNFSDNVWKAYILYVQFNTVEEMEEAIKKHPSIKYVDIEFEFSRVGKNGVTQDRYNKFKM